MSYFESKALREERGAVVNEIHAIAKKVKDEGRTMTGEEIARYDSLNTQQEELKAKIDSAERVERSDALVISTPERQLPSITSRKVVSRKDHENALRGWAFKNSGREEMIRSEHVEAAEKVGVNLNSSAMSIRLMQDAPENLAEIKRDVTEALTNADHAENENMLQGVESALLTFGQMRSAVTVIRTANGNILPWLPEDDTGNVAAARDKLGEVNSTAVAFGNRIEFKAFSFGSGVYPVAVETLEDSGISLTSLITSNLGMRLARKENAVHTTGAGTTEPKGIATCIAPYFYYPDPTSVGTDWYDVLVKMQHHVDSAYRGAPKCGYMFSDSVLGTLRLMVDGIGRPLWQTSLTVGAPDVILGKPYTVNNDLGDADSTTTPAIIFGDMSKFMIRDVGEVTLTVLRERYAELNAIGFLAFHRTDSNCINTAALCSAKAGSGSFLNCGSLPQESE